MNTKDGYAKKSLTSARLLTADGGDTDNYLPLTGGTMTGALVTTALSVAGAATFSLTINGSILGNAATASRLLNARTISLTGAVTGNGSFDGSANLNIATTTNSIALDNLSNVTITNPVTGLVLTYNGTEWVNDYLYGNEYIFSLSNGSGYFNQKTRLFILSGNHTSSDYISSTISYINCKISFKMTLYPSTGSILICLCRNNTYYSDGDVGWLIDSNVLTIRSFPVVRGNGGWNGYYISGSATFDNTEIYSIEIINGVAYFYVNNSLFYSCVYTGNSAYVYINWTSVGSNSGQISDFTFEPLQITTGGVAASTLSNLNDVSISSLINHSYLRYDGTNWVNISKINFYDIDEIGLNNVSDGQILRYDFNSGKWKNYTPHFYDISGAWMADSSLATDTGSGNVVASIKIQDIFDALGDSGITNLAPSGIYFPMKDENYYALPVIIDADGKMFVPIPKGVETLCDLDLTWTMDRVPISGSE